MVNDENLALTVKNKLLKVSGLIVLAIIWEIIARAGIIDGEIFPRFTQAIKEIGYLWVNEDLYMHIMSTLWRFTVSLIVSTIIGIPLGIFFAQNYSLYMIFEPLIRIFSKINPFSLLPVLIAFLGVGENIKLISIIWVGVFPILFQTIDSIMKIDSDIIKTAKSMAISKMELIIKVYIPTIGRGVFVGIRISVEMIFFMIIVGEMLGVNSGMGYLLHNGAHHYFDAPKVYASCIVIVFMGVVINKLFRYVQDRIFFWEESTSLFKNEKIINKVKKIDKFTLIIICILIIGILVLGSVQMKVADYKAEHPIVLSDE